jgi:uncharacterized membrane protein
MMFVLTSIISWNHIHPVLVHFSTALVPASLASDVLGKYFNRRSLTTAAWWMVFYGAIATPLTAFAGWMWSGQFPASGSEHMPGLSTHMWLGFALIFLFGAMALWRAKTFTISRIPSNTYLVFGALVVAALMYQGFLGGQMTIG